MKNAIDNSVDVMPSATPTKEDIRNWDALPRDEQLRRLRAALTHPDCATATPDTMSDILAEAHARADSRSWLNTDFRSEPVPICLISYARSNTFRLTVAALPVERTIRNWPDQSPGMLQRPSISVSSALSVPSYAMGRS